jgi:tetratricopeptide (TPR) repeat protein
MRTSSFAALAAVLVLAGACGTPPVKPASSRSPALSRLGDHSLRVTTQSAAAQRAFDRGLTLAYSFGHYAAEQEFRAAAAADPDCAMAFWGIALVNGPHINLPLVPPDRAATAWQALEKAKGLAPRATPFEQALIEALSKRYASPQPEDRSGLDQAYAAAMREVWRKYPRNADAGILFAEAAMDLHPWDFWKDGSPQPWTPEVLQTLETVLRFAPAHPGANHLYIHAVEASPEPQKALAAADRLARLVPDSSHMVHMPSHIYARVGNWEKAAESNEEAMKADVLYRAAYPRPGFYNVYMAHNAHFLAFTAMMRGRSEEAIRTARTMVSGIPEPFLKEYGPVADGYMIFVSEALMRFGRWQEILEEPEPKPGLPLSQALWHFTRAVALAALDRMPEAKSEQEKFLAASERVPAKATFGNNSASDTLQIATLVLEGELAAHERDFETAKAKLTQAVKHEDALRYNEPPDWIQPVRHTLGAVLLRAGDVSGAEQVYREDLRRYPENGWSLMGLRDCLARQGQVRDAAAADKRFKRAWAVADVMPRSTCYCQAGR